MSLPKLIFFCGKMAAGKSTLAHELAEADSTVLLEQDDLLKHLYPGEIDDIPSFVKRSGQLQHALTPHICALIGVGVSVVLDFPGNTRGQRRWFRELIDAARCAHELHFIDVSDEVCKAQLKQRSEGLPDGSHWTTDEEFHAISAYFEPPSPDEGFHLVVHGRQG